MRRVAARASFMKIMIRDYAEQLELPAAFVMRMGRRADGTFLKNVGRRADGTFLKNVGRCADGEYQLRVWGSGGRYCWIVEAEKDGDGLFFRKGWPEFLEDNNIGFVDVLLFFYEGRNKLLVKIFDPSGIKRHMASMITEEEDVAVEAPNDGNGEGDDEPRNICPHKENGECDAEPLDMYFDEPPIYYINTAGECHLEAGDGHEKEMQGSMELTQEEGLRPMELDVEKEKEEHDCATPKKKESLVAMKEDNEPGCVRPSQKQSASRFEEEEKENIKKSYILPPFSSNKTHFIANWSSTWQHYLTIPKEIAIEKDLHSKSQLLIRDLNGKIWFMKLSANEDGTINLTEGWSKFCSYFGLEEGDTCTFEFISGRIVHVHVHVSATRSKCQTGL